MANKAVAYGSIATGVVLVWSSINNSKILDTAHSLVAGTKPVAGPAAPTSNAAIIEAATGGGDAPQAPATISGNVALGKLLAAPFGWSTGSNWNSLYALWERESGWSNTAENGSSGAYGIAQALGHGPTNQYPAGPANPPISSAAAQIAWGLTYIKETYGNPNNAWAHEVSAGWY
jgi:hypothetical protein